MRSNRSQDGSAEEVGCDMVLDYDTRPTATVDEKLRSLIASIQLALAEAGQADKSYTSSQSADMASVIVTIRQIEELLSTLNTAVGDIGSRLTTAEESIMDLESSFPAAPLEDGAYKLTVTVTDGIPVYTWESE